MNEVERLFIYHSMISAGIIPLEDPDVNVNKVLKTLSPEDAKKLKRKFRKLWRRLASRHTDERYDPCGIGAQKPSRWQKYARKDIVRKYFWSTFVEPNSKKVQAMPRDPPKK
jgi:hypothetical protein